MSRSFFVRVCIKYNKIYKIAIFMYKVFHKTLPMTVLMLFMQNHSSYRTRQSKNFFLVMQERIRSKGVLYILEHVFGIQ